MLLFLRVLPLKVAVFDGAIFLQMSGIYSGLILDIVWLIKVKGFEMGPLGVIL
jgi:hypothetical protein